MKIDFDTSDFEFSHARKPRGTGGWAFGVNTADPHPDRIIWAPYGTLTDAKQFVRETLTNGETRFDCGDYEHVVVYVLP